jgi:hypothetical protein
VVSLPKKRKASSTGATPAAATKAKVKASSSSNNRSNNPFTTLGANKVGGGSSSKSNGGGVQMAIDFGQKSLGRTKECLACGMTFVITEQDDVKKHAKFCTTMQLPVLHSLKGHKVLSSTSSGNNDANNKSNGNNNNESVIIEVSASQTRDGDAIRQTLDMVEKDLGSSTDFLDNNGLAANLTIYMLIAHNKAVVGCVVLEDVGADKAQRISSWEDTLRCFAVPQSSQSSSHTHTHTHTHTHKKVKTVSPEQKEKEEEKESQQSHTHTHTHMGIRLIWTHSQHRRQNVASRLVDAARKHYRFGAITEKSELAFSQPTRDGFDFGVRYCNESSITVYH